MNLSRIRAAALSLLALALVVAWAVVIWIACIVSTSVLNTLDMIIELAALS